MLRNWRYLFMWYGVGKLFRAAWKNCLMGEKMWGKFQQTCMTRNSTGVYIKCLCSFRSSLPWAHLPPWKHVFSCCEGQDKGGLARRSVQVNYLMAAAHSAVLPLHQAGWPALRFISGKWKSLVPKNKVTDWKGLLYKRAATSRYYHTQTCCTVTNGCWTELGN